MKTTILLLICLIAANSVLVDMGTWIADTDNQFEGMTLEERRQYLGSFIDYNYTNVPYISGSVKDLPVNFDAREKWPNCIHPIMNQAKCGSCWAFAGSEAFSDRVCIATNGEINEPLSPQELISCDTLNSGCRGGHINYTWSYIETDGLVSDACFPYVNGPGGNSSACNRTCANGDSWTSHYATNFRLMDPDAARESIMTQGPIETAFNVYKDFDSYKSGVYVQNSTVLLGGHAVKIIGWGYDETVSLNYWLVANSWGPTWGMDGYFKIVVGCCGFGHMLAVGDYDHSRTEILSFLY